MDGRVLRLEELQQAIRDAAVRAGLDLHAEEVDIHLSSMDRVYSLCLAPKAWESPYRHYAHLQISYLTSHTLRADDPDSVTPEKMHEETEVQVEYQLLDLGDQVLLRDLEGAVRPLLEKLNAVLEKTHQVYYTVSTDYQGKAHAFEAKVPDLYTISLIEGELDTSFLEEIATALGAIGP